MVLGSPTVSKSLCCIEGLANYTPRHEQQIHNDDDDEDANEVATRGATRSAYGPKIAAEEEAKRREEERYCCVKGEGGHTKRPHKRHGTICAAAAPQ